MEMAIVQLGGHPVTIRPDEVGIGKRKAPETSQKHFLVTTH